MKQHEMALLLMDKARQDEALLDVVSDSSSVSDEILGFHAQQAAEKLLKAVLAEFALPYPRTRNLRLLMDTLKDAGHVLPSELSDLDVLTPFAVLLRYEAPPFHASLNRPETREMIRLLRQWVQSRILGQ